MLLALTSSRSLGRTTRFLSSARRELFCVFLQTQQQQPTSFQTMASMEASKIIGDVVDKIEQSGVELDINYGDKKLQDGAKLSPTEAKSAPLVRIDGADKGILYTLLMSDPDPPDPQNPVYREWLHWLVTNIPGDHPEASQGTTVTTYMGPSPPIGTHRYAFLLFQQPTQSPLQSGDPSAGSKGRKEFKTREFAAKYGLGNPVAGIHFLSHK